MGSLTCAKGSATCGQRMAQRADGAVVWHRALTSIFWELTPFCRAFDDVPEGQPGAAGWSGLALVDGKVSTCKAAK